MNYFCTILLVILVQQAFACEQSPDSIIIQNRPQSFHFHGNLSDRRIKRKLGDKQYWGGSACYVRFKSHWLISNDSLFLTDVTTCGESRFGITDKSIKYAKRVEELAPYLDGIKQLMDSAYIYQDLEEILVNLLGKKLQKKYHHQIANIKEYNYREKMKVGDALRHSQLSGRERDLPFYYASWYSGEFEVPIGCRIPTGTIRARPLHVQNLKYHVQNGKIIKRELVQLVSFSDNGYKQQYSQFNGDEKQLFLDADTCNGKMFPTEYESHYDFVNVTFQKLAIITSHDMKTFLTAIAYLVNTENQNDKEFANKKMFETLKEFPDFFCYSFDAPDHYSRIQNDDAEVILQELSKPIGKVELKTCILAVEAIPKKLQSYDKILGALMKAIEADKQK